MTTTPTDAGRVLVGTVLDEGQAHALYLGGTIDPPVDDPDTMITVVDLHGRHVAQMRRRQLDEIAATHARVTAILTAAFADLARGAEDFTRELQKLAPDAAPPRVDVAARALWLRRNRNTGPAAGPPRPAPKIGPGAHPGRPTW